MKNVTLPRVFTTACVVTALVAAGCDEQKQHNAAEKAGDAVEKTVNVVGDVTRDAAHAVGGAVEKAGDKMQDAADKPATRNTTTAPTLP